MKEQEKRGFWSRYKFLILGVLGAVLLIGSLSVQNVILSYEVGDTQYAVKLDYSAFNMCLRCYPANQNSSSITEKAVFFAQGREKTVLSAAAALQEIAGRGDGVFYLHASGITGKDQNVTEALIASLNAAGFQCADVEEKN